MATTPANYGRVDSKWLQPLEYCLFATAAIFGLLVLLPVLVESGLVGSLAVVYSMGLLALVPLGFVFGLIVAVLLYLDSRHVRTAGLEWAPSPGLYGVLGLLFSGLAVIDYLYKRNEHATGLPTSSRWWYGVVGLAVLALLTAGLQSVTSTWLTRLPELLVTGLPICLYRDSGYLRETTDWRPNPATYFTAAWVVLLVFILFSTIGAVLVVTLLAVYGIQRHRALEH
ncbi:hypothetical protein [Natronolimnobius baerhuensis]|uniref:Uncharacterized protein n=1 Tax=Natronolimnobius baerhuensis TaxID=253108 RepID=A0A202E599_9EURY|nr:hypothetical protein [Natronolimnobius baerhuensis]OVE83442.1 hypothetical protein B2G88_13410 [Natronolimnobius baerhuensis]